MNRPSRKAIREALETTPIDQVLGVPGELTHKQRTFARLIASGNTGAESYRKVYSKTAKPKTAGDAASRMKKDSRIAAEIEAFKLANEAAAYHAPQQLRALVIHSLVQVVTDPDAKQATKVQAAKVLGTVAGVDAFVHRSEHRVIKTSEDARAQLLAKLREVMTADAVDVTARDVDSLLADIMPADGGNVASAEPAPSEPDPVSDAPATAEATPTPQNAVRSPTLPLHTIPHTESFPKSEPPSPIENPADDLEAELRNTPR